MSAATTSLGSGGRVEAAVRNGGPFRTNVLTRREELASLGDAWRELVGRDGRGGRDARSTIFQTWEWVEAWWSAVNPPADPFVIVVVDASGRTVGIAPFYRVRLMLCSTISYRCLRIIGDHDSSFDYPSVILDSRCASDACAAIVDRLKAESPRWDCIWLQNAATWDAAPGWASLFRDHCRSATFHVHERPAEFGAFELPPSYADYLASLSANARSSLKRQIKRIESNHRVSLARCLDEAQLESWLDRLFELHRARWNHADRPGGFAPGSAVVSFYRAFAPKALARGWLRMFGLEVDGTLVAVQYGYVFGPVFYQIQEGFSPESAGAGSVLRARVMEALCDEGVREYDFLGGYTDHKRRWGAVRRLGCDLFVGRRSLKNLVLFGKEIWPTGRWITQQSP